jgi:CBS domain-containing protein
MLKQQTVSEDAPVEKAMMKFRRKGKKYSIITTETELAELEAFFNGGPDGKSPQDFAVVTDGGRKFVLGVVTRSDLEEFVKRRPG